MSDSNGKDVKIVPFEDALDRTGFGLYSYLVICVTGLISVSFIFVVYATTFIVPTSACELETTSTQQGLALAVPAIGGIIGTSLWGYLADVYGRRSMLLLALLLSAATNALASLSVNWLMLAAVQFITVSLATGKYILAMTLVSESVPKARRNVVVLLVNSIFLIAQGIMALIAIPIIRLSFSHYIPALGIYWNSWRTLLVIFSVPSLLSAAGLYFLEESPKFAFALGAEERALEIMKTIHKVNKGRKAEEFEVTGLVKTSGEDSSEVGDESKSNFLMLFKAPLLKYTLLMTPLIIAIQLIVAVLVWLPVIADQFATLLETGEGSDLTLCDILDASFHAPEDPNAVPCSLKSTGLLIVFGACALHAVVNTFVSQIVDRVGNRYTAMGVTAVTGVAGILVNLVPNAVGSVLLLAVFTVGIIVLGIYSAIGVALFPTHLRALAMSLLMSVGYLASFGLVQLLNFLITLNCELVFYLYTSLFLASAFVLILLPDDRPIKNTDKKINSS